MSRQRTRADAGWCEPSRLPRGPEGRALCRQCSTEVPKGRRTFCSQECVDAWRITADPSFARHKVSQRDNGVCADCGRDCEAWRAEIRATRARMNQQRLGWGDSWVERRHGRAVASRYLWGSLWDADHIEPVQEGGGACGLDNFQTLCVPCHQLKTARHAARRAGRRMATGQLAIPGMNPTPNGIPEG